MKFKPTKLRGPDDRTNVTIHRPGKMHDKALIVDETIQGAQLPFESVDVWPDVNDAATAILEVRAEGRPVGELVYASRRKPEGWPLADGQAAEGPLRAAAAVYVFGQTAPGPSTVWVSDDAIHVAFYSENPIDTNLALREAIRVELSESIPGFADLGEKAGAQLAWAAKLTGDPIEVIEGLVERRDGALLALIDKAIDLHPKARAAALAALEDQLAEAFPNVAQDPGLLGNISEGIMDARAARGEPPLQQTNTEGEIMEMLPALDEACGRWVGVVEVSGSEVSEAQGPSSYNRAALEERTRKADHDHIDPEGTANAGFLDLAALIYKSLAPTGEPPVVVVQETDGTIVRLDDRGEHE